MSNEKTLSDIMSMMVHQLRGVAGTIGFNAKYENDPNINLQCAQTLTRVLKLASVLSFQPESLKEKAIMDNIGDATPLSVLDNSLHELLLDLTSPNNIARMAPYYMNILKQQGIISQDVKTSDWKIKPYYNHVMTIQNGCQDDCKLLTKTHEIQKWMNGRLVPLSINGLLVDEYHFEENGIKHSILNVLFTELLKNAIKHSDPTSNESIVLQWTKLDNGIGINCTNHSTRSTRIRESSKGSGYGHKFLRMIVENLGGSFEADVYTDISSVSITIPNW